nr:PRD domain-containing protein [Metabacillus kandeliae]
MKKRLEILYENKAITHLSKEICESAIDRFIKPDQEESYAMLVTHLAMAITRHERKEAMEGPPEEMMAEIRQSFHLSEAEEKVNWIEAKMPGFPEEEKQFLLMHFVSALNNEKREGLG